MAFALDRTDWERLLVLWCAVWALYLPLVSARAAAARRQAVGAGWVWGAGVGIRAMLLFSIPNWSDDIWRFLWDGRLIAVGIHPFADTPRALLEGGRLDGDPALQALFPLLNSPDYYSVYPPLMQLVFAAAAWAGLPWAVTALKLPLLAADIGVAWFLRRLAPDSRVWIWYFLNPLVLMETCGNAHFEGMALCCVLAALFFFEKRRAGAAGVFLAAGAAVKLTPLMFLPAFGRAAGWRGGLCLASCAALTLVALFAPMLDAYTLSNKAQSLDLYFRQFAFNGSLHPAVNALAKACGVRWADRVDWVGPLLGMAAFLLILRVSWRARRIGLYAALMWAGLIHLLFSATVHPWYLIPVFGLSLLTPWRFPLIWTGAIAFSYSHYADGFFQEKYVWIAAEYALVLGFGLWEWARRTREQGAARDNGSR
ncbi:MAG: glycosyltransferase 87 family protein [Saprospiraceae bacterium]